VAKEETKLENVLRISIAQTAPDVIWFKTDAKLF